MSSWFKQVANSGLSYLNSQIEPIKQRGYGKSPEQVQYDIKCELRTAVSRSKDVERQIERRELNAQQIKSLHQELNFRVQNLDENRQFLFKQTNEYECKLEQATIKKSKLLIAMNELKEELDFLSLHLRSISLNLKGATELKEGTLEKIPRFEENRRNIQRKSIELFAERKQASEEINELCEQRDSIKMRIFVAQKKVKNSKNINNNNTNMNMDMNEIEILSSSSTINNDQMIVDDSQMTTIFDNSSSSVISSVYQSSSQEMTIAVNELNSVHNELYKCESSLDMLHNRMGPLLLNRVSFDKDLMRLQDLIELQQQSLSSIEQTRIRYSLEQQKYLKSREGIEQKMEDIKNSIKNTKIEVKKHKEDIQAIGEASNNLSLKKIKLAKELKRTIDKENEISNHLKILHRNRMSLRSRKTQLLKQQMTIAQQSLSQPTTHSPKSIPMQIQCSDNHSFMQSVSVIRMDCMEHCKGMLNITNDTLTFVSDSKYSFAHDIVDISHSSMRSYKLRPVLSLFVHPSAYKAYHIYNENTAKSEEKINDEYGYEFKINSLNDKKSLLIIHDFIESKRIFVANALIEAEVQMDEFHAADIELCTGMNQSFVTADDAHSDIIYCVTPDILKSIIVHCPTRTHLWKWQLFYSTMIHGISMLSFYANCSVIDTDSILIIRDLSNHVFGAYIDVAWDISTDYRGSIDCFVFNVSTSDEPIIYKSTGNMKYFVRNDMQSITIGAGSCSALYIDGELNFGHSSKCATFNSPILTNARHKKISNSQNNTTSKTTFKILVLEVWAPCIE